MSEEPVPDNSAIYVDGKKFPTNMRFSEFQLKHDGRTYGIDDTLTKGAFLVRYNRVFNGPLGRSH